MVSAAPPRSRPASARRLAAEEERRLQLIQATIAAIAEVGFAATTVAEIARRANVSTGLVAFYFRDKDGLLEATLRHLAADLARAVTERLRQATLPRARLQAVIDGTLGPSQFDRTTATVWLAFWGQVPHNPRFQRVQRIYQRRMATNLVHALREALPAADAVRVGHAVAALIDGLWLRATLADEFLTFETVRDIVSGFVETQLNLADLARLRPAAEMP